MLFRSYITEYNTLAFDEAFAEMESKLDALQYDRDLERLQVAVRAKHWQYAQRLAIGLRTEHPSPEVDQLYARLMRRSRLKQVGRLAAILTLLFVLYALSAAPVYRLCGRPEGGTFYVFYRPLAWVQNRTLLGYPLEAYAGAYDAHGLFVMH